MAGRSRDQQNSEVMARADERNTRRDVAWARGAQDTSPYPATISLPALGPYETRYDVCRGYCTEREIVRP